MKWENISTSSFSVFHFLIIKWCEAPHLVYWMLFKLSSAVGITSFFCGTFDHCGPWMLPKDLLLYPPPDPLSWRRGTTHISKSKDLTQVSIHCGCPNGEMKNLAFWVTWLHTLLYTYWHWMLKTPFPQISLWIIAMIHNQMRKWGTKPNRFTICVLKNISKIPDLVYFCQIHTPVSLQDKTLTP